MSMHAFQQAAADLGINVDQLKAVAPAGVAAGTPTATTTVAGTVLQGDAVADCVPAADGTSAGTQLNLLLAELRANGTIAT